MRAYKKDYPRPQLARDSWVNLNGLWDFQFDDEDRGEEGRWFGQFPENSLSIRVPYTYETKMSGIFDTSHHPRVWYHRVWKMNRPLDRDRRVLLHLEGCDFEAKVWVNGSFVGVHRGGYARFSFDISHCLQTGENDITVRAEDFVSLEQPRGKQRWAEESFACWYVQTTGIWKTVWLEEVHRLHLEAVKLTPNLGDGCISTEYRVAGMEADEDVAIEEEVTFRGAPIALHRRRITRNPVTNAVGLLRPDESPFGIHSWSPERPELYDLTIRLYRNGVLADEAYSYFGMREVRIDKGNILINGSPVYQRLILDQGYWGASHLTPPDEQALIDDIDKLQAMGYNGVRKHMKVEDERFLYWCDVKGLLVWSEMAAFYEFTDAAAEEFTREWLEVVRQNYSHPSIIVWTPFNESWGIPEVRTRRRQQAFTEAVYQLTRSLDAMRPVITNDGWEHTISDILTLHDYEEDGAVFSQRYAGRLDEIAEGTVCMTEPEMATV